MFKRLLRSRTSENVMAVDELVDSAMRTRVKPDTEKTGVGGKKLGDGVIYPFGAENEAPNGKNSASKGRKSEFTIDTIFRMSKDGETKVS